MTFVPFTPAGKHMFIDDILRNRILAVLADAHENSLELYNNSNTTRKSEFLKNMYQKEINEISALNKILSGEKNDAK